MLEASSGVSRVRRRVVFFCWSLCVLLPALASAQTTTVTAVWEPSPSPQVSHYEVCIGTASLSCNIRFAAVDASKTAYEFAPPAGQLVYVAVRALNSRGRGAFSTEQRFSIPSFAAPNNRSSAANAPISPIDVSVIDPDASPLTFTHTGLPLGVTMHRRTGRITGTPISAGMHDVTIFVSDGLKTVSRSFLWSVTSGATADVTPPTFTITSHASGLVVTTARQTIRGTATDSGTGGSGIRALRVNGQSAKGGTVSASKTANWSHTITLSSGSNTITVDAVDGAGNIQMQQFTLLLGGSSNNTSAGSGSSSGPLAITGLTSNLASPQSAGTTVTFFTGATGGRGPYQFKWFIFDGASWSVARDWSSATTLAWRPTRRAAYRIGIWARDATTKADVGNVAASVPFTVKAGSALPSVTPPSSQVSSPTPTSGPLTITGLTSNLASPQSAGTSVTFFTAATGGRGPYQFKWFVFDGVSWTVARDWSSATTLAWRPTTRAAYRIGVWARDATTKADVGNVAASVPFKVRAAGIGD
jgi:Glucodextranase, domain B